MRENIGEDNAEDIELMSRIARGEEAAFSRLLEKHQHAVIGTIAKMTHHSADTEDLAQQVFLRIWKSAKRYQPKAKFTTYLFTITRNLVFNYCGKQSRRKEYSLDADADNFQPEKAIDQTPSPDDALEDNELKKKIEAAIASLPEKQRLAVTLRQQERMPYEEISNILNLSIPSVKSILFRARKSLREKLQPYLED